MASVSKLLLGSLFLAALTACTNPSAPVITLESPLKNSGIIDGTRVESDDNINDATVIISQKSGPYCSGILLNDHVVLTAAHCLNKGFPAETMSVTIPSAKKSCFAAYGSEIALAPVPAQAKYQPDLALLKLSRSVCSPPPVVFMDTPAANETFTTAGFGYGGLTAQLYSMEFTVVNSDKTNLKNIYRSQNHAVKEDWELLEKYYAEFSDMYLFALSNNPTQTICRGDSGGPVYRKIDGVIYLAGVNGGGLPHSEKGISACQNTYLQFFNPVGPSLDWIENQLQTWK